MKAINKKPKKANAKGTGQLKQIGARWYLRVAYEGKRYDIATGKTSEAEALKWQRDFNSHAKGGIIGHLERKAAAEATEAAAKAAEAAKITFAKAFAIYEAKSTGQVAPRTQEQRVSDWGDFAAFADSRGVYDLAGVTESLALDYRRQLQTIGKFTPYRLNHKNFPLAATSIIKAFSIIKLVFKASAKQLPHGAEAVNIDMPPNTSLKREVFTVEECDRIIAAAAADPILFPIVMVCKNQGLRLKDAACLQWTDIDLNAGDFGFLRLKMAKTGGDLKAPLTPELRAYLDTIQRVSPAVFPETMKFYLQSRTCCSIRFRNLLIKLGIDCQTKIQGRGRAHSTRGLHALRHSFVYHGVKNGIKQADMQKLVGHLSPKMTAMYSDHASEEDTIAAMKLHPFGREVTAQRAKEEAETAEALALIKELGGVAELKAMLQKAAR